MTMSIDERLWEDGPVLGSSAKRGIMTYQLLRSALATVSAIGLLGVAASATGAVAAPSVTAAPPPAALADCPTPATFDPRLSGHQPDERDAEYVPLGQLPVDADRAAVRLRRSGATPGGHHGPGDRRPAPNPVSLPAASASPVTTVDNAPYNGAFVAGQTTAFGFIATGGDWSSASLAGLACTPTAESTMVDAFPPPISRRTSNFGKRL